MPDLQLTLRGTREVADQWRDLMDKLRRRYSRFRLDSYYSALLWVYSRNHFM